MTNLVPKGTFIVNPDGGPALSLWDQMIAVQHETLGGPGPVTVVLAAGQASPPEAAPRIILDTQNGDPADDCERISLDGYREGALILVSGLDAGKVVTLRHRAGGGGELDMLYGDDVALTDPALCHLFQKRGTVAVECLRAPAQMTPAEGLAAIPLALPRLIAADVLQQVIAGLVKPPPLFHIRHTAPSTIDGGSTVANTWTPLPFNDVLLNEIPGALLAGNSATLPAGTWDMEARHGFSRSNHGKIRLQNLTAGTTLIEGMNFYSNGVLGASNVGLEVWSAHLTRRFNLPAEQVVQFQYFVQRAQADSGLGGGVGIGTIEVYGEAQFRKLA